MTNPPTTGPSSTDTADHGDALRRLWPEPSLGPLAEGELLAGYLPVDRDRPFLRVNFVSSADGAVAVEGLSRKLSGPGDKVVFKLVRTVCDAVMVGAGTLRQERYRAIALDGRRRGWRRENGLSEYPTLVIVSGRLDLDPADRVFADAPVRPVVVTHGGSPVDRRDALAEVADVLVSGDAEVDLVAAREALAGRGLRHVLCEGGPHLFGSLLAADAVDELCLTMSPQLAGAGAGRIVAGPSIGGPVVARLAQVLVSGEGELLLRYARR